MTLAQLEQRVAALEAELHSLRHEILRLKGITVIPGFGPVGTFKDDPGFDEVVRLGKAYRDKANRESLKEFDRTGRAKIKKKPKRRKTDARA
jgi:hypothetical protein